MEGNLLSFYILQYTCAAKCMCSSSPKVEPQRDLTPSAFSFSHARAVYWYRYSYTHVTDLAKRAKNVNYSLLGHTSSRGAGRRAESTR